MPVFNRCLKIRAALDSIVKQTYLNWEAIIVDDASTDGTEQAIEEYLQKDSRVHLLRHGKRKGAQAARNTGINAAKGKWVVFLDSDDQLLPNSLELRLESAKKELVKVVHSDFYIIRGDGNINLFGVPTMTGWVYRGLLSRPGPLFQGLMVAKEALEKIGYLDERIISYQEWDTVIRLAKYYQFSFVAQPTFIYDCRGTDTISKDMLRDARGYEQVFRKHFLEILIHGGPPVLAQHYRFAASRYRIAGDWRDVRRCTLMAHLCWPFSMIKTVLKIFKSKELNAK